MSEARSISHVPPEGPRSIWGYRCPNGHRHARAEMETGNPQHPFRCPTCGTRHTMLVLWHDSDDESRPVLAPHAVEMARRLIGEGATIRLTCHMCDDDHDGITPAELRKLIRKGWSNIVRQQSLEESLAESENAPGEWYTHLGYCPKCNADTGIERRPR